MGLNQDIGYIGVYERVRLPFDRMTLQCKWIKVQSQSAGMRNEKIVKKSKCNWRTWEQEKRGDLTTCEHEVTATVLVSSLIKINEIFWFVIFISNAGNWHFAARCDDAMQNGNGKAHRVVCSWFKALMIGRYSQSIQPKNDILCGIKYKGRLIELRRTYVRGARSWIKSWMERGNADRFYTHHIVYPYYIGIENAASVFASLPFVRHSNYPCIRAATAAVTVNINHCCVCIRATWNKQIRGDFHTECHWIK